MEGGSDFGVGVITPLFAVRRVAPFQYIYDVSSAGQRFLVTIEQNVRSLRRHHHP
jgi:hypothetical protein